MFKKISLIKEKVFKRLFRVSVRFNAPRISGVALALLTSTLNKNAGKRVLYIGSAGSLGDIDALMKYSGRLQYLRIERWHFRRILDKYVPYSDITETSYYHEEKYREGLLKVREFIDKLFSVYRFILSLDAVMTTNIGYIEQLELLSVCKSRKVPVVILFREGVGNRHALEVDMMRWEKKKAICDLFICNGDLIKEKILEHQIEGLDSHNMKVCGIPRLDVYSRKNISRKKNQLVFFTYETHLKMDRYFKDQKSKKEFFGRSRKFTEDVFKLADDRQDIDFILKTKGSYPLLLAAKKEAEEYFKGKKFPSNLRIICDELAADLILESRWVLGSSDSTVVLEAIIAKRPVACPDFDDLFETDSWDLFEGPTEMISRIRNYDDLAKFVKRGDHISGSDGKLDKLLERYFYKTDGFASERVERAIEALL